MTEHIDLDAIESIVREAMDRLPLPERDHEAIEMRCLDVLALVRAVRAAMRLGELNPQERWVGVMYLSATLSWPAERAPFAEFNAALAPFRKEAT